MAEIHLAKTEGIAGFEKYVALKMIHPNFSMDDQFIQMLIDEAKITVQLQHVNVAQTFDLGRVDNTYYITMEYVDGADLYKLLRKGSEQEYSMPVDVSAYIAKELANGLDYAHRKRDVSGQPLGIVHRDVSPQNVLISHAGEVKLVDFGIAKATMRARQTAVGVIKGKYYYMSPEQAWGDPVDHRTDIFSTGIVLYEMLTGQMLYLEEDLHKLLNMVRRAEIAPPTTLRRDIPPQLERIVMNALAKRAEHRYQNAADFATDLERFLHVYSPVFTASKVSAYFHKVLGEKEIPTPRAPEPAPVDPARVTKRVDAEQLARDRSDFTDENSVIYRLSDLRPDGFDEDTGAATSPNPLRNKVREPTRPPGLPPSPGRKPRGLDDQTLVPQTLMPMEEEEEERTVISGPPGFGMPEETDTTSGSFDADYEPTMVQGAYEEDLVAVDLDDDNPTLTHQPNAAPRGAVKRKSEPAPPSRGPLRKPAPGAAAHPALAARSPKPAVSALRKPRTSRRTPASGTPIATPSRASGASLISSLVDKAVDKAPTRPVRQRNDAVPNAMRSQQSQLPVNPSNVRTQLEMEPARVPRPAQPPPTPSIPDQPTAQHHAPQLGHEYQLPAHLPQAAAMISPAPGFPLAAPIATPNPFRTPGAPPLSFTKQLVALEADAIPDAYKIGRARSPWVLRGALGAACVVIGAVVGVFAMGGGGDKPRAQSSILIESMPSGAMAVVNGTKLDKVTPVIFKNAKPGERYTIQVKLPRHRLWSKEVLIGEDGGQVKTLAFLETVRGSLRVTSTPQGADVVINGTTRGQTPVEINDLDRDETKVVQVRLRGYKLARKPLKWGDQKTLKLHVKLQK